MMNLEAIQPMRTHTIAIPPGDAGTEATVAHIRKLIEQGKKSALVRETAVGILRNARIAQHDQVGESRAVYYWVLRSLRFTRDIRGKETLHSADEILRLRVGDCDDYTILMCSLLGSIGHKLRIVTVSNLGPDPETGTPGEFTHIYPEDHVSGRWIPLDAARRRPAMGRGPRHYTRKRIWDVEDDDFEDVAHLNFYESPFPAIGAPPRSTNRSGQLRAWAAPMRLTPRGVFPGRGRLPGMGFDFSALVQAIQPSAQATTEIIAATKGAATTSGPGGVQTGMAPVAYSYPFGGGTGAPLSVGSSLFSSPMMLLLLVGGGILLLRGRS